MHLTLHFLGGADAALEQRARDGMARALSESAFDVTFDGLGCFPERGSPRVLWLGIRDGLEPLRRIQRSLAEQLQIQSDHEGPFTPHLTLARLKDRIPRTKLAKIAEIPAFAGPSRIDRVTLYESRLSPLGPTYLPLAEALLADVTANTLHCPERRVSVRIDSVRVSAGAPPSRYRSAPGRERQRRRRESAA